MTTIDLTENLKKLNREYKIEVGSFIIPIDFGIEKGNLFINFQYKKGKSKYTIKTLFQSPVIEDSISSNFHRYIEFKRKERTFFIEKRSLLEKDVQFDCECSDYQFTFKEINFENNCGLSKPDVQKTGKHKRNPEEITGYCKHIFNVLEYLKKIKKIEL